MDFIKEWKLDKKKNKRQPINRTLSGLQDPEMSS
jgi:hypothetical protein